MRPTGRNGVGIGRMNDYRRIAIAGLAACGALCATAAHGAKDFSVEKDMIVASAPDANGNVTVSGPPGTVRVGANAPAEVTLENTTLKPKIPPRKGVVGPDGSFSVQIPGAPDHKIKIVISSPTGGSKKTSKRVPLGPVVRVPPDKSGFFSQSAAPPKGGAFSQPSPRRWLRPAEPTPEITINYRDSSSRPSSSPLDPDEEVRQSGVLPPANP